MVTILINHRSISPYGGETGFFRDNQVNTIPVLHDEGFGYQCPCWKMVKYNYIFLGYLR